MEILTSWTPPRQLLVSASAGERVPTGALPALRDATDTVESAILESKMLPFGDIEAVEVTVRYSAKGRGPRQRKDRKSPPLACFVTDEPIEEMLNESVEQLRSRFVRALVSCLEAGAKTGVLPAAEVELAARRALCKAANGARVQSSAEPLPPVHVMDVTTFWKIISDCADSDPAAGTAAAAERLSRHDVATIAMFDVLLVRHVEQLVDATRSRGIVMEDRAAQAIVGQGREPFESCLRGPAG